MGVECQPLGRFQAFRIKQVPSPICVVPPAGTDVSVRTGIANGRRQPLIWRCFVRGHSCRRLAGHCELNAAVKCVTASMMPMRRLGDHAAARDTVEISVEPISLVSDAPATAADTSMFGKVVCVVRIMRICSCFRPEIVPPHRLVVGLREPFLT